MSKDEEKLKDTKTQQTDNKQATQHGQRRGVLEHQRGAKGR
jgi:hypothetical protein